MNRDGGEECFEVKIAFFLNTHRGFQGAKSPRAGFERMKPKGEVSLIMTPANEGSVSFYYVWFHTVGEEGTNPWNPAWLFGSGEVKRSGAGSNTPRTGLDHC